MAHKTKKDKVNPMGAWWRNMGEKTHGDLSKYNKKAERRENKNPKEFENGCTI